MIDIDRGTHMEASEIYLRVSSTVTEPYFRLDIVCDQFSEVWV